MHQLTVESIQLMQLSAATGRHIVRRSMKMPSVFQRGIIRT